MPTLITTPTLPKPTPHNLLITMHIISLEMFLKTIKVEREDLKYKLV